jgi:hypothetical protein
MDVHYLIYLGKESDILAKNQSLFLHNELHIRINKQLSEHNEITFGLV